MKRGNLAFTDSVAQRGLLAALRRHQRCRMISRVAESNSTSNRNGKDAL